MNAWAVGGILLFATAWVTAAATAARAVSRIWLRHWVEQRLAGAETAQLYLDRPQRLLVAARSAIAGLAVALGATVAVAVQRRGWMLVGAVVVAGLVLLVFGQLFPRALARRWAPRMLPVLLPVLRAAEILALPALLVARAVSALVGRRRGVADLPATEHDVLEDLLRDGEIEGIGRHEEIEIITGVVHFAEKRLRDVMTPREDVFAVDESAPASESVRRIAQSAYSRVPVYRGTLDHIVGLVHAFDILEVGPDALPPLHPVLLVKGGERCDDLLVRMLQTHMLLAVVQDDDGRTLGIVTLEDLLEELVGEIRDEHDEPQPVRAA